MLPTFMTKKAVHQSPDPPPSSREERVMLAHLRPFGFLVGTIEGMVGDEVLVRFGEIVVQVPPDLLESVDEQHEY
jgi:hypothetical protein